MLLLLSIVALVPASFGIGNWPWASFGAALFSWTCKLWALERIAMASCLGLPHVLLD